MRLQKPWTSFNTTKPWYITCSLPLVLGTLDLWTTWSIRGFGGWDLDLCREEPNDKEDGRWQILKTKRSRLIFGQIEILVQKWFAHHAEFRWSQTFSSIRIPISIWCVIQSQFVIYRFIQISKKQMKTYFTQMTFLIRSSYCWL